MLHIEKPDPLKPLKYSLNKGDAPHRKLRNAKVFHNMGFGKGALSYEEALLLYTLVIISKPKLILETGSETGASTMHLAMGLAHNGFGELIVLECDPKSVKLTVDNLTKNNLNHLVTVKQENSLKYLAKTEETYDFAFLDTLIGIRMKEYDLVKPRMKPGSLVAIHDTLPTHPKGNMKIDQHIQEPMIHMESPRRISVVMV
tara:strand:+ start:696 stop:1298 length:603 start_codon:yes stop_codon:yes gene_type:complete